MTGMSGAGKTEALRCLEDLGYYAIDNLPASLLTNIVELSLAPGKKFNRVALGMDIRGGKSFKELFFGLDELKSKGINYTILFLDASDKVLVSRFSLTRRMHPLESEGLRVVDTISEERKILDRLRERADIVIDTSDLNIHELRDKLKTLIPNGAADQTMKLNIVSFGYKFGLPLDADLVLDARFLPNPYWVKKLQNKTGHDAPVKEYVTKSPGAQDFISRFMELAGFLIPMYLQERRSHLTIGVGCTGGRHRSVVIADELVGRFREGGYQTSVLHRDIDKK